MNHAIKSNIKKLIVLHFIKSFQLVIPIIVLFYLDLGFTLTEIIILQAIFSFSVLLLEVPSGYFADVYGRKTSIIIGFFVLGIGYSGYSFFNEFYEFVFVQIFIAIGLSFYSGANSALMFETHLALKETKKYKKIEGVKHSAFALAEIIASLLGGLLVLVSLRFPFYFQPLVALFGLIISFSLVEIPKQKMHLSDEYNSIKKVIKYSLKNHYEILLFVVFAGLVSFITLHMFWFTQPFLKEVSLPLVYFGVLFALFRVVTGVSAYFASEIESFFGRKTSLIGFIVLPSIGFIFLSFFHSYWGIILIFIFQFIFGVSQPIVLDCINQKIPSEIRATINSMVAVVMRLLFFIVSPIIAYIADIFSLSLAFLISGILYFIFGVISLIYLHKYKFI